MLGLSEMTEGSKLQAKVRNMWIVEDLQPRTPRVNMTSAEEQVQHTAIQCGHWASWVQVSGTWVLPGGSLGNHMIGGSLGAGLNHFFLRQKYASVSFRRGLADSDDEADSHFSGMELPAKIKRLDLLISPQHSSVIRVHV